MARGTQERRGRWHQRSGALRAGAHAAGPLDLRGEARPRCARCGVQFLSSTRARPLDASQGTMPCRSAGVVPGGDQRPEPRGGEQSCRQPGGPEGLGAGGGRRVASLAGSGSASTMR